MSPIEQAKRTLVPNRAAALLGMVVALPLAGCTGEIAAPVDPAYQGATTGGSSSVGTGGGGPNASGGSGGSGNGTSSGGSSQTGTGGSSTGGTGTGGSGTGGSGNSGGIPPIPEQCDRTAVPSATPLRRLGRAEYLSSLRDLLEPNDLAAEVDAVGSQLEQLPPDGENEHLFTGMDRRLTQRHVDAYYGVAEALAKRLTEDDAKLEALAGDCATASAPSETCVSDFLTSFGARAFRRPLSAEETSRYLELRTGSTAGSEVFYGVLFSLFLSPEFLYHLEIGGDAVAGQEQQLALTGHEIASRLSYVFWGTMPDSELLEAAASGELTTEDGFEAAVDRVFDDPRTRQTLRQFWGEWLGITGFGGFVENAAFRAFAGDVEANDALFRAMTDETHALIDHFTWDAAGSYHDVLTSRLFFSTSDTLADLYGVEAWSGSGDAPELPAAERSGLLTRAALLAEGNEVTNPIKRGAFILKHILCEELDPPSDLPPEALALPEADPTQSTRARFEAKTSPAECRGCHAMINPLGFSLEMYDALGRFRTEELIYADDGDLLAEQPINPAVEVELEGVVTPVETPVEFAESIAAADSAYDCLARQYFRFSMRRNETAGDACSVADVRDRARGNGSLRETFRSIALDPAFRRRVMETP